MSINYQERTVISSTPAPPGIARPSGTIRFSALPPPKIRGYFPLTPSYALLAAYSISEKPKRLWSLIRATVVSLLPIAMIPAFFHLGDFFYPALRLLPGIRRGESYLPPPSPHSFFRELFLVILSAAFILTLQTACSLLFPDRKAGKKIPWAEAGLAGGLTAVGVFGVVRGFQGSPADSLFYPLPALSMAIAVWIFLAALITVPPALKRNN